MNVENARNLLIRNLIKDYGIDNDIINFQVHLSSKEFKDFLNKTPIEYNFIGQYKKYIEERYFFVLNDGKIVENTTAQIIYEYANNHTQNQTIDAGMTNKKFLQSQGINIDDVDIIFKSTYEIDHQGEKLYIAGTLNPSRPHIKQD